MTFVATPIGVLDLLGDQAPDNMFKFGAVAARYEELVSLRVANASGVRLGAKSARLIVDRIVGHYTSSQCQITCS